MGIGQDVAIRRKDENRSQGIGLATGQFRAFLEEALEKFQVRVLGAGLFRQGIRAFCSFPGGCLSGADIDHGGFVLLDQFAKIWKVLHLSETRRRGGHTAER